MPVAYIPCLDVNTTEKPLNLLKAGVVSEEQVSLKWFLFEHGSTVNCAAAALQHITHFNVLRIMTIEE